MGLGPFSGCSLEPSCIAPNPNPGNFTIKKVEDFEFGCVALIHYNGCTNFEGNKILVFKGLFEKDLQNRSYLDPHFEDSYLSPIARFKPTDEGWELARRIGMTLC